MRDRIERSIDEIERSRDRFQRSSDRRVVEVGIQSLVMTVIETSWRAVKGLGMVGQNILLEEFGGVKFIHFR